MKIQSSILFLLCLFITGCTSSKYVYHLEPTPLRKGNEVFELKELQVNLTLGHGALEGDTGYANQETLSAQFKDALNSELKKHGMLPQKGQTGKNVSMTINFERRFNYGGKSLNTPLVSDAVNVFDENKVLLASYSNGHYSPNLGMVENLKIATFQKTSEDELKDVALIASILVSDLKKLGK